MSIRTAILALSPLLYWPLDETSGVSAADASGNGNTGDYYPGTLLGAPGPEVGTFAAASSSTTGGAQTHGNTPVTGMPILTLSGWFDQFVAAPSHSVIMYDGNSGSTGCGMVMDSSTPGTLRGGIGFDTSGFNTLLSRWHHLVFTEATAGVQEIYVDGSLKYTSVPFTTNSVIAANPMLVQFTPSAAMAHFACWGSVLSAADVLSLYNGRVNPQESTSTGRALTDLDLGALQQQIFDCCAAILASVRKTY